MTPHLDFIALLPEVILLFTTVVVIAADLLSERTTAALPAALGAVGATAAFAATVGLNVDDHFAVLAGGTYVIDGFALIGKGLVLAMGAGVLLLGVPKPWPAEYVTLILAALLGMVAVASARDLVTFFVAFELLAVPGYLLVGWAKQSTHGHEAALKYYLLGVLASAVMLYGLSLLFGLAGGTRYGEVARALSGDAAGLGLARIAIAFVVVGMALKISAVPFHFWAPDAYQGAPTPVAAFLSTASKLGGFVALLGILGAALPNATAIWSPLLYVLCVSTLLVGNLVALRQSDLLRLLAWSSISQTGFILVPLALTSGTALNVSEATEASVEYLAIYAFMNLGAFGVVVALARSTGTTRLSSVTGLFFRSPGLAVAFTAFLVSLAGAPPLGGWFAKLVVTRAALQAGTMPAYLLAGAVAVSTALGLAYYARVVRLLWVVPTAEAGTDDPASEVVVVQRPLLVALTVCLAAVVMSGILPSIVTDFGELASLAK